MKFLKLIAVSATLVAASAMAQTVSGVKVEPAQIKAGESVKVTVSFDNAENPNCAMKIRLGDGREERVKINQAKDTPFVFAHTYAKAGNYTVVAEPSGLGSTMKCSGKNQTTSVAVAALPAPVAQPTAVTPPVAAAPAPAAPASAAAAKAVPAKPATPCPEGWALAKPGVSKKTQSFTCTAKPGTKIPEPKVACPGDLTYFDNSKKGQLGCRV